MPEPIPLPPPEDRERVGGGDFAAIGREFLGHLRAIAGLRPEESVLDAGCGYGRTAAPLTAYLDAEGRYAGFDVSRPAVDWCVREISSRFGRFRFDWADVHNGRYHPRGKVRASDYVFPYPDASFDVALSASVFTHMLPRDMEHYVAELARVLRPGGRCLATYFLLGGGARGRVPAGLDFRYAAAGCALIDPTRPEAAVAYEEGSLRVIFARHGFALQEPVRYGSWSGRRPFTSYQDIVLLRREGGGPAGARPA